MKTGRGRRVALVTVVLGVVAIVVFGFSARRRLLEAYHVAHLESKDVESRYAAIRWIAQNGSESACLAVLNQLLELLPYHIVLSFRGEEVEHPQSYEPIDSWERMRSVEEDATLALRARFGGTGMLRLKVKLMRSDRASARGKVHGAQAVFWADEFLDREVVRADYPGDRAESLELFEAKAVQRSIPAADRELALSILAESLSSTDPWVRAGAAYGLREAGAAARQILPALQAASRDKEELVREAARRAVNAMRISGNAASR